VEAFGEDKASALFALATPVRVARCIDCGSEVIAATP